ncbi:MAG: nucleoside-triphosphatase [Chloroflexota bacterium]|nr:nucleoside-triphosphatase [Chloroflexota bacterium]
MLIALLGGEIGAGKTTVCQQVVNLARERGFVCGGLLTPALVENGHKVGIIGADLSNGERRVLARTDRDLGGSRVGCYHFTADAFDWANALIASTVAAGCDLLAVDEIGPLELEHGGGLAPALNLIAAAPRALIVVRLSLVDVLRDRLKRVGRASLSDHTIKVFLTTASSRDRLPDEVAGWLFGLTEYLPHHARPVGPSNR